MNPIFLLLAAAVLPCGIETESGRIAVGLFAEFRHEPPPIVRHAVREELAAIVDTAGLAVEWRSSSDGRSSESWTQVATLDFHGHCDTSDLRTHVPHSSVLGQTHLSDGAVIPYGEIDCDAIRAFLAVELGRIERIARPVIFGRAVGRVIAHELFHILARSKHHGSSGIGKQFYAPRELVARQFKLQNRQVQQLRLALSPRRLGPELSRGRGYCATE